MRLQHAAVAVKSPPRRALAGDHQHVRAAAGLRRAKKAEQRIVRLRLRHAVQIEPAVDRAPAARDALLEAPAERRQRRRPAGWHGVGGAGTRPRFGRDRRAPAAEAAGGSTRPAPRRPPQRRDRARDALPQERSSSLSRRLLMASACAWRCFSCPAWRPRLDLGPAAVVPIERRGLLGVGLLLGFLLGLLSLGFLASAFSAAAFLFAGFLASFLASIFLCRRLWLRTTWPLAFSLPASSPQASSPRAF